jgi:hypothetical protein
MNTKWTSFTELVVKGLLLFPIFTVLQGISIFDSINRIWLIIVCIALLGRLLTYRYSVQEFLVLIVTLVLHVIAIAYTEFPLYNFNMLFYFLLWVLLYVYFAKSKDRIMQILEYSHAYINVVLWCWTVLVGVSIFLPSCYNGSYFFSFAGSSFRLMPATLIIAALAMYMVIRYDDSRYTLFLVIPTYAAFMNQSRTYFGVYVVFLLMYLFMRVRSKKNFYLLLGPFVAAVIGLMLISGIADKIEAVWRTGVTPEKFLSAFTNARTVFWKWDMEAFFDLPVWQQFVGNGFNFAFDVTKQHQDKAIWAHNDIINMLMNFGYIGAMIYIWAYFKLTNSFFKQLPNVPVFVKVLFHGAVFLNSMMNMSYTYFCSVIAYPIFLLVIAKKYTPQRYEYTI